METAETPPVAWRLAYALGVAFAAAILAMVLLLPFGTVAWFADPGVVLSLAVLPAVAGIMRVAAPRLAGWVVVAVLLVGVGGWYGPQVAAISRDAGWPFAPIVVGGVAVLFTLLAAIGLLSLEGRVWAKVRG